jgi:predicted transcriptional regulator
MSDIERTEKTLIEKLKDVEEVGLLHIKGYSMHEIASLMALKTNDVKSYIDEYKKILNRQAEEDPYFLERVQFNTVKALQEFDQLSKEAWETINIATDHGMVPARISAIKLAGELATKKAQLHKLLGINTSDGEYIARMQKAENVNQILSRVLRDVISKYPEIADAVRRELAIAFEIMAEEEVVDVDSEEISDAEIIES